MLIKSEENIWDDDGNDLVPGLVYVDWKVFSEEVLESIAEGLDPIGVDVIDYETGGDFWAFRFVNKEK